MTNLLSFRALPLYAAFFLWSVGTGAVNLARPLFAASFGVSVFLVTVVVASNSVAHLVSGPITGLAMDRWGRKPLLILGLALRAGSGFAQFFAQSYVDFLLLEFIGGFGVAMWGTGSAVLVADLSVGANRGRAVASRSAANRLGMIVGPFIGGAIAASFDLRAIFLFNGLTKLAVLLIVVFLVRETSPDAEVGGRRRPLFDASLLSQFATRAFIVIALVSLTVSMMTQGVFQTLFPLFLHDSGGLTTQQIGMLMTIAGISILVTSLPNGYLVDRFGRKATLVPGLFVLAAAAMLLPRADAFSAAAFIVVVYGVGTGMCQGAAQVYVMDLAPRDRRGAFLGMWALLDSSGGALAPLAVGSAATSFGFGPAFLAVGTVLAAMGLVMWLYGPDTFRARDLAAQRTEPTMAP